MTIEQKRRELFEAWFKQAKPRVAQEMMDEDEFVVRWMFEAYCAALDAVVIELPEPEMYFFDGDSHWAEDEYLDQPDIDRADPYGRIDKIRAAIEQTNLGLKVLP